jgi:hypothetical protein
VRLEAAVQLANGFAAILLNALQGFALNALFFAAVQPLSVAGLSRTRPRD